MLEDLEFKSTQVSGRPGFINQGLAQLGSRKK
jgi:hypothetical protein